MTTYKLVLIPHRQVVRGMTPHGAYSGADERYFPFGHLPKEYLQVPPIERSCFRQCCTHCKCVFSYQNSRDRSYFTCHTVRHSNAESDSPEIGLPPGKPKRISGLSVPGN